MYHLINIIMEENKAFENLLKQVLEESDMDIDTEKTDSIVNRNVFKKAFITTSLLTIPFALAISFMKDIINSFEMIAIIIVFFLITYCFYFLIYKTLILIKLIKILFQKLNEKDFLTK